MPVKSLFSPLPRGFVRDSAHQYGMMAGLIVAEFLYTALLARGLGLRVFGVLVLLLSAARICQGVTDVRVHELVIRYAEEARATGSAGALARTLGLALRLDIAATAAGAALAIAIAFIVPRIVPGAVGHRRLFLLAIAATGAMWIGRYWSIGVLRLFHHVDRQSAVLLAGSFARLIATAAWFSFATATAEAALIISIVCSGVAAIALIVAAVRAARAQERALEPGGHAVVNWRAWRGYIASNYGIGLLETAYRELDVQLVGWFRAAEQVSIYKVAKTFASALLQVVDPVVMLLLPQFARDVAARRGDDLRRFVAQVALAFAVAGIILGVVAHVVVPIVLPRLVGSAYFASILPFRIIVWCIVATMPILWTHALCMAFGRPHLYLATSVIGACVLVALTATLVPSLGAVGAAWSYGISQITTAVLSFAVISPRLRSA